MNKVQQALSRLVLRHKFYAAIALSSPIVETTGIPTAGTDGNKIYWNPEFINQFPVSQVEFIMAHEVEHIVRLHVMRRLKRDPYKWNTAADHGINLDLIKQGMDPPVDKEGDFVGIADKQYAGMSAEQVYAKLPEDKQQSGGSGEGNDKAGDQSNGSGGQPNDWSGGDLMPSPAENAAEQAEINRKVAARITSAAAQVRAQAGIGAIPAHLRDLIGELTEPKVAWQYELREFLTATAFDDYSWSRLNRRLRHRGLKIPSLYSHRVGAVGVLLDTSGSCHRYIPEFLSEVCGVAQDANPESITLRFVDTKVQATIETDAQNFEADMGDYLTKPPHGGGTDLRTGFAAFDADSASYDCIICLTDMQTPWPDEFVYSDRTLFVDVDDGGGDAPFGRKVVMG